MGIGWYGYLYRQEYYERGDLSTVRRQEPTDNEKKH